MQYLALIHAEEEAWLGLDEAARQEAYDGYRRLGEEAQAAGVLVDGAELAPTTAATTVRVRDGQTLVSDGPYAEVKESLGGYYLFECDSIEEAVQWAARIPAAHTGGAVEVRPVHVQEED